MHNTIVNLPKVWKFLFSVVKLCPNKRRYSHEICYALTIRNCVFIYCSKLNKDSLTESLQAVLQGAKDKKRNFLETVELQVSLKNYDPQKDKRFSGTVR